MELSLDKDPHMVVLVVGMDSLADTDSLTDMDSLTGTDSSAVLAACTYGHKVVLVYEVVLTADRKSVV